MAEFFPFVAFAIVIIIISIVSSNKKNKKKKEKEERPPFTDFFHAENKDEFSSKKEEFFPEEVAPIVEQVEEAKPQQEVLEVIPPYTVEVPKVENVKAEETKVEAKPQGKISAVHANCNHHNAVRVPYQLSDTYSMEWSEYKDFCFALLKAEYKTRLSPYKYRGSPDLQIKENGEWTDVRLIQMRAMGAVDDRSVKTALDDLRKTEKNTILMANGKFTQKQMHLASQKSVRLIDNMRMEYDMKRLEVSPSEFNRKY